MKSQLKPIVVFLLMAAVLAFILLTQPDGSPDETPQPSGDQIHRGQGEISQDMSPDPREDDEPIGGYAPEPRLVPDLSHITAREPVAIPDYYSRIGTFTGVLPCANCSGIDTELVLYIDSDSGHRRYLLRQTYKATRDGDQTYWESGPWEVIKREDGHELYRLSFQSEEHRRSFSVHTDRIIRLLDRNEEDIDSGLNYNLYRLPN